MSGSLFTADPLLLGLMALQISYCRYSPSKIQFKQTNKQTNTNVKAEVDSTHSGSYPDLSGWKHGAS